MLYELQVTYLKLSISISVDRILNKAETFQRHGEGKLYKEETNK